MRKALLVTAVLIVVPVGMYYYRHHDELQREKAAYERRLEEMHAADGDIAEEPITHDESAAALLAEAHELLVRIHGTPAGEAYGFTEWDDWDDEDHARFDAYMQAAEPYRDLVERALQRPGSFHDYQQTETIREHYLWRVRTDRVADGRTARAARTTILLLDCADKIRLSDVLGYSHVVTLRVSSLTPLSDVYDLPGFDAALFRRLVDERLARAERPRGPPAAVLKQERMGVPVWVEHWFTGDPYSSGIRNELTLYRTANARLDVYTRAIAAAEAEPGTVYDPDAVDDPLGAQAARIASLAFSSYTDEVATLRLGRVVLAVLEHRQSTGIWPAQLPAGLPLNPITGKPFAYERTAAGVHLEARPDLAWDLD